MSSSESTTPPDEAPKKRKLPMILAIVAGLGVGVGGGGFMVGPLVAERLIKTPAAADSANAAGKAGAKAGAKAEKKHGEGTEKKAAAPGVIYLMDNLVLNPAGTSGTRFLMVSIAFRANGEAVSAEMKARDAELRDAALRVLQAKTVEQLADVTRREALKAELGAAVAGLLPAKSISGVFLPQFVIQ